MEKIILCLLTYTSFAICYQDELPYSMFGLFSISSCQGQLNFDCGLVQTNERIIRENLKRNENVFDTELDVCNIDIGTDRNRLMEIFLDLIVKKETSQTCLGRKEIKTLKSMSTIVYLYTTHELTVLESSMALPYDIVIIAITFEPMTSYPSLYYHNLFIYSYEASFGVEAHKKAINEFRKKLNITYLAVLNVYLHNYHNYSSTCSGEENRAFCVYTSIAKDGCWMEKSVNVSDDSAITQILDVIQRDKRLSYVFIYGNNEAISKFYMAKRKSNIMSKYFFLPFEKSFDGKSSFDATSPGIGRYSGHTYYTIFYDVPGARAMDDLFHYLHHLKGHLFKQNDFFDAIKQLDFEYLSPYIDIFFPGKYSLRDVSWNEWKEYWNFGDKSIFKEILIKALAHDKTFISGLFELFKGRYYIERVKANRLHQQDTFNPYKALDSKPYCAIPTCKQGKELKHFYFQTKFWDANYGWFCQQCTVNFYKYTSNNTKCIPCPKNTRSDPENLFCYDPYKDIVLSFHQSDIFVCLTTACIIETVSAVAVLLIFVKFRNTPLVRASNTVLSFIQIITHAILGLMLIFLFMGKPNREICVIRPLLIGVCFTLNTTINLGKTQKILMIFKADLRMSKKEIAITKASEIITILMMVIIDVVIFGITIRRNLPNVKTTLDEIALTREYYCDNNSAVLVQFAVIFLIVIFNVVQGIRSRNLPSYFRESTYVLYSSFTSCVIFVATIAIYTAQENEHRRTILLFTVCAILNAVHFLLMYTYKVFVILFRPERNTKKAFDEKRKKRQAMLQKGE